MDFIKGQHVTIIKDCEIKGKLAVVVDYFPKSNTVLVQLPKWNAGHGSTLDQWYFETEELSIKNAKPKRLLIMEKKNIKLNYSGYSNGRDSYRVTHKNGTAIGNVYYSTDHSTYVFLSHGYPIVFGSETLFELNQFLNELNGLV